MRLCDRAQPALAVPSTELIGFLETKEMAKIKLPERLLILDDLPLSNFGKVSKKRLSELASERAVAPAKPARA